MTLHTGLFSDLPPQARTVVLVGGRGCDHLRELVRVAEFQGRAAYRIEDAAELQPRWFVGAEDIGVVAGTAHQHREVDAVLERLRQFAATQAAGMLEGVAQ